MSAAQVFGIANPFALIGWAILVAAIVFGRPWLRDAIAGTLWPFALSALYIAALAIGWGEASGGSSSLADVRSLFASDWMLLAGWVHYLAFDLFVGAWIAGETERAGTFAHRAGAGAAAHLSVWARGILPVSRSSICIRAR